MTERQKRLISTPIMEIRALKPRIRHAMANTRCFGEPDATLGDFLGIPPRQLLQTLKNFGRKSLNEFIDFLRSEGLSLPPDPKEHIPFDVLEPAKRFNGGYVREYLWIPTNEIKEEWRVPTDKQGYTRVLVYAVDGKLIKNL